jgi:hypothetical protein
MSRIYTTTQQAFDAVSIPASGGTAAYELSVASVKRLRVLGGSAGADVSLKVQTSGDGGTTWHDLATYAAGAVTGARTIVDVCDTDLRLLATNANPISAQSITAQVTMQAGA